LTDNAFLKNQKRSISLIFEPYFKQATLIKRYKRFLADIRLPDGSELTIHCPNTGSMRNCSRPESKVWYSTSDNKKRKYPHTFEIIEVDGDSLAGINTSRANALVREAIEEGVITELKGYSFIKAEVKYGEENSRIDFLLQGNSAFKSQDCFVEIKNVTLEEKAGLGLFPDAVSTRGTKHLRELMHIKEQGQRAVLVFCVQHTGVECVEPAWEIDPVYSATLLEAAKQGVEVLAYKAEISPEEIRLDHSIPVNLVPQS